MTALVAVEERGDVALLRVQRPPANALDPELLEQMLATIDELGAAEPGAVVIAGSGSFFSAGIDVKVLPGLDDDHKREMVDGVNRMLAAWYALPRPLVCAAGGHAVAGGLVLLLCGDVRVGSDEARYGLTEVRVGVPYPACALELIRSELTPAAARQLALSAGLLDPRRALELGVLDELAPADEVEPRALELACELAALPSRPYAVTKAALREEALAGMERAMEETDPVIRFWLEELAPS